MPKPLFSILIAHYNNYEFFLDCYKSILSQTIQNFEVIILDDFSEEVQCNSILELVKNDERFKVYRNDSNKGVGYTKRKLVELANGEICGFLDPDDALEPQALEIILNHHNNNTEVGLIYSNFIFCDDKLEKQNVHYATQITALDEHYLNFQGEISHFATFKKSIYNKTTGIDAYLKIAEDKDWYMKMCEVAPVLHINENLYLYRIHNGGISTNKNSEKAYFWHWVALIKMAERRNINIEDLFIETFVNRSDYIKTSNKLELLKKSRLLRLLHKIGLFKGYKYL